MVFQNELISLSGFFFSSIITFWRCVCFNYLVSSSEFSAFLEPMEALGFILNFLFHFFQFRYFPLLCSQLYLPNKTIVQYCHEVFQNYSHCFYIFSHVNALFHDRCFWLFCFIPHFETWTFAAAYLNWFSSAKLLSLSLSIFYYFCFQSSNIICIFFFKSCCFMISFSYTFI